uniref:Fungal lipase-type domain-containing protein n=1 Tax=Oryza meridionalis TaxID=40149 RepID=A0A0E0C743_9ORYZ
MASLVQGVYVMERDRQGNRHGSDARAPAWWRFFHFEVREVLVDADDSSIFGAVYAFQPPWHLLDPAAAAAAAPHYVVAFRGTITKKASASRDLTLDLQLVGNGLDRTSRFHGAMRTVHAVVAAASAGHQHHHRVWLAGHSLGSAISTLAAKSMARAGVALPTFLFNAPFPSAPVERIGDRRVRQGVRIASSFVTAAAATLLHHGSGGGGYDAFAALARWVPNVFVNPGDPISAEYVGYFDHRKKMEDIGAGAVGRVATRNSVKDLLLGIGTAGGCEPLHLFPSAVLTVNRGTSPDFKAAHGIHQWWRPDLALECAAHYY